MMRDAVAETMTAGGSTFLDYLRILSILIISVLN